MAWENNDAADDLQPASYAPLYEEDASTEEATSTENMQTEEIMLSEQEADTEDAEGSVEDAIREDLRKKRLQFLREVVETIAYCTIVVVLTMVIKAFVIQPIAVDGTSMQETLQDNDIVLLEKVSYWFSQPERFDIIVFRPYENTNEFYVKRVIGLPGEVVYIDESGQIHIADSYSNGVYEDDRILEESYGNDNIRNIGTIDYGTVDNPAILGDGEFYVLGDNRNNSRDSRKWDIGSVPIDRIEGKVVCRLIPIPEFGIVY